MTVTSCSSMILSEALGSAVRDQLTSSSGAVTYAKDYDPYGTVTSTAGASQTAYGYTGEFTSNDLVYLRARHYAPGMGRFLTRDKWSGNYNSPQSLNRWMYTGGNPVNRTDPNGQCWYPQQGGGVGIDYSDLSPLLCSWFINYFQGNGITIPPDATPENWWHNIPPDQQSLIAAFTTCVFQNDTYTFIGPSTAELWQVIRFYTRPKWQYYSTASAGISDVEFKLFGVGGDLAFSCENDSLNCGTSAEFDLGPGAGFSIMGYKLELSTGLGVTINETGSIQVGGTADVGPCGLFVNFVKISIECTLPPFTKEWGWTRGVLPQQFYVLAKSSVLGDRSEHEEFARKWLPFTNKNITIYSLVEDVGTREDLGWQYFGQIDYVFE